MAKRRATLRKRSYNTQPTTIFVVACEGEATERIYFEFIHRLIQERNLNFRFKVQPLSAGSGPRGVLGEMERYVRENDITREDHAWLVMDIDHHTEGKNLQILKQVLQRAGRRNYGVALSNACFEVWLMLHFTDTVPCLPSMRMERKTRDVWPNYKKSNYNPAELAEGITKAIERAKARDVEPDEPVPTQSGTRVYHLMETLRACIQKAGGTAPF